MKIYTKNLKEKVLEKPALKGCTSLKIITGFTDTDFIYQHLIKLADYIKDKRMKKVSVEMILGMIDSNGLSQKKHECINRLIKNINSGRNGVNFICRYKCSGEDIHSKVYVWLKNNKPIIAFCGSANYSSNAFLKRRECVASCDSYEAERYFEELKNDSILSTDPIVKDKISFSKKKVSAFEIDKNNLENLSWEMFENKPPLETLEISLLTANGKKTGYGSGLNWGIRKNGTKRNRDQAYIPYNKSNQREGFFPLKKNSKEKHNPLFKVVPKNFPPFFMRIAQGGNKGIHTAENNALLGLFFRQKLNIPSGKFITKKMLKKYGKDSVVFKKYGEDLFVLDF